MICSRLTVYSASEITPVACTVSSSYRRWAVDCGGATRGSLSQNLVCLLSAASAVPDVLKDGDPDLLPFARTMALKAPPFHRRVAFHRPGDPRSACARAASIVRERTNSRKSTATNTIMIGPPTNSAAVNCQPIHRARITPSSTQVRGADLKCHGCDEARPLADQ